MIVQGIMDMVLALLQTVFGFINLPDFPASVQGVIDEFTQLLVGSVGLFSVFFRMTTVKILIPVVIVIVNFEKIYRLVMFILKKIPFLGIE